MPTLLMHPLWNLAIPILLVLLFEVIVLIYFFRSVKRFNDKKEQDSKFPRANYSKKVDWKLHCPEVEVELDAYERSLS